MATMAAFRLTEWLAQPELVEAQIPEPGPGQVRIRVAGCGLCHSDVTMTQMPAAVGETLGWQIPFTLGHETAGWVDAVGPDVSKAPMVGTAVVVASPASCGHCRWCRRGQENACPDATTGRGYGRDGGFAEYVLIDDAARVLAPLGALDPHGAGPLSDAGATSFHAVQRVLGHLDPESAAVVVGIGGLGGYVVQILRALAPDVLVVAVEPDPDRRARAVRLGAQVAVDGVDAETVRQVVDASEGRLVDALIDLVGTNDTLGIGSRLVAPGGAWGVVGAAGGSLRRPWYGSQPRDGTVFSFQGSDLSDLRGVVALAADGRLALDAETVALADAAEAFTRLAEGAVATRLVLAPRAVDRLS